MQGSCGARQERYQRPVSTNHTINILLLVRIVILSYFPFLENARAAVELRLTIFVRLRFVVVSLAKNRFSTPHVKKSLNPTYDPKDATFDIPIYQSIADVSGVVELLM